MSIPFEHNPVSCFCLRPAQGCQVMACDEDRLANLSKTRSWSRELLRSSRHDMIPATGPAPCNSCLSSPRSIIEPFPCALYGRGGLLDNELGLIGQHAVKTTASLCARTTFVLRMPARLVTRMTHFFNDDSFTGHFRMMLAALVKRGTDACVPDLRNPSYTSVSPGLILPWCQAKMRIRGFSPSAMAQLNHLIEVRRFREYQLIIWTRNLVQNKATIALITVMDA
jgi:hypothetical protein